MRRRQISGTGETARSQMEGKQPGCQGTWLQIYHQIQIFTENL